MIDGAYELESESGRVPILRQNREPFESTVQLVHGPPKRHLAAPYQLPATEPATNFLYQTLSLILATDRR